MTFFTVLPYFFYSLWFVSISSFFSPFQLSTSPHTRRGAYLVLCFSLYIYIWAEVAHLNYSFCRNWIFYSLILVNNMFCCGIRFAVGYPLLWGTLCCGIRFAVGYPLLWDTLCCRIRFAVGYALLFICFHIGMFDKCLIMWWYHIHLYLWDTLCCIARHMDTLRYSSKAYPTTKWEYK
jgi:hypothetical protein